MNYQGHHRHAQYIIANSELFGFTPQQRAIMSAIARYLGKSRPDPEDRTMRPIPPEEFSRVQRAVVLLSPSRGAESGPGERRAESDAARVSQAGPDGAEPGAARERSWNCGRYAKKATTSAKSSGASFLQHSRRSAATCANPAVKSVVPACGCSRHAQSHPCASACWRVGGHR